MNAFGTSLSQNFLQPAVQGGVRSRSFRPARRHHHRCAPRLSLERRRSRFGAAGDRERDRCPVHHALLGLDARLKIARETVTARENSLRIATSRDRAGYSTRLELRQAQAELDAAAQIVPQIEVAIARTRRQSQSARGELPGAVARAGTLDVLTTPPVPDGLPSQLLDRRPDIVQAANQLAAADASLAAARKRFLPQLRLTASAGRAFSSALEDPISIWSIGGSVLAPLFEGGRIRAQAEAAALSATRLLRSISAPCSRAFAKWKMRWLRSSTSTRSSSCRSIRSTRSSTRFGWPRTATARATLLIWNSSMPSADCSARSWPPPASSPKYSPHECSCIRRWAVDGWPRATRAPESTRTFWYLPSRQRLGDFMKLYDRQGTPNAARIRIVLAEKGLDSQVEFVPVDLIAAEQKQPAFLRMNPIGKTPGAGAG